MNNLAVILSLVVILVLVWPHAASKTPKLTATEQCPPGYYESGEPTSWAGWIFNCKPIGQESSLTGVPKDMDRWAYGPIVKGTGPWQTQGEPAN
jgi:hypothetical protein